MAQDRSQRSKTPTKGQGRSINQNNCHHASTNTTAANGQKPQPAKPKALQESSNKIPMDPSPTCNNMQHHQGGYNTIDATVQSQSQSQSQLEEAIWKAENASLENEFLALKTTLGSYMELQRRIFHDLGGEDDNNNDNEKPTSTNTENSISTASAISTSRRKAGFGDGTASDAEEVAAAVARVEYDQRGRVLSDAVRYIQYLETLRDNLASEKSELEVKVIRWEELGFKVTSRLDECMAE